MEKNVSEEAADEPLKPYPPLLAPPPQNVQKLPAVVANAAIRYKNSATVYLHLNHSALASAFYLESSANGKRINVDVSSTGEAVIKGVPKFTDFKLFASINGKPFDIAKVTTKADAVGGMTVSNMLYEETVKWQVTTPRPSLFEYIQSVTKANVYEKTAFLQQFYLGDKDLETESPDGAITVNDIQGSSNFAESGVLPCKCKLIFNYGQLPIPYAGLSSGTLNSRDWGTMEWSDVNGMNVLQFGTSGGANKYAQFQTNGKRLHSQEITINTVERGATQTAAFLDYSLVCEGGNENPDCGCSRDIDIMYQFDAHLRTSGGNVQCFMCGGNRGSSAQVEEAVTLTVINHRQKTAQVVEAVRAKAKTEISRDISVDFFVNVIDLAAEVGKLFLPNAQDINSTAVDNIKTKLIAVIRTPFSSGGGTNEVFKANMMDNFHNFKLYPNEPVRVVLASLTKASLGGRTAWWNIAESNTDFALAGVVKLNGDDRADPNCCSPKFANWVLGGFQGSVVGQSDLRQKVGMFVNRYAPWDRATNDPVTNAIEIRKDVDYLTKELCSGKVYNPFEPVEAFKGSTTNGSNTWVVAQKGSRLFIDNNKNKLSFSYTVCDALGRVMASGQSAADPTQTSFELNNVPSGMYFLRVEQSDKRVHTLKFTKMQ